MKTSGTTLPTFSDDGVLHFTLPTRWAELTQKQLRYVFFARALYGDRATEYILCRFLGLVIVHKDAAGWLCSVTTDKGTWTDMMITIWRERIERLRVHDTYALHQQIEGDVVRPTDDMTTITHKFLMYGIYQDRLRYGGGEKIFL